MKQTYGIIGIVGVFLLLLGAAGVYAHNSSYNQGQTMMGTGQETYQGMMRNIDQNTKDQMNQLHDQMIKNLDPETAKQMDAMHDACMGNTD